MVPPARRAHLRTGVTVPYLIAGAPSAPPLVLLHAWAEARGCFERFTARLPSSLRVVAMDQRGHGEADKPPDGYRLVDFAADAEAFLDALGIDRAVVLGSSSGGYVAQQLAISAPERVAGLVLVGAPRSLRPRPSFADEVERLTDPIDPAWVRKSLTWFPRFHPVPERYVADRVADGLAAPARVWRRTFAGLVTAVPPTEVSTISAPALIIWGARDELLTRADEHALAAAIPGSRLVVYEDTGHLVLWEQPRRLAIDVAAFVASLTP
jgi:pimeloyl-ACP methyl ester carboxylesterase